MPTRAAISATLTTRGYTGGTADPKKFVRAQVQLDTWNPTATLTAIFDGPGETQSLAAIARDRTKYFTSKADFDPSNVTGGFHTARRQDYSVVIGGDSSLGYVRWAEGASYSTNAYVYFADNGHNYRARQSSVGARTNAPGEDPRYWYKTSDAVSSLTPTWTEGSTYYEGLRVVYRYNWHALIAQVATYGNDPSRHPEYWEDLGLDAGTFWLGSPAVAAPLTAYHSADVNQDAKISYREYVRVLELYYYTVGTTRTGEYHTDALAYSGFAPGPGAITTYHSADTDQNGRISLVELTRVAELSNSLTGTVRTGVYHVEAGTEDGFAPGADPATTAAGTDGVRLEDFQTAVERRDLGREAAWCQLSVSHTTGAIKIRAIDLEAQPGPRANLRHS